MTGVAAAFAALAALATHPLLWQATRALPGNLGDPLLNTFILGWDASRIPHGFAGVWSAPFFFPLEDALALSEHLLGVAIFAAPVVWLTANPVLAYNLALFGSYVLSGVGMYLLARSLWGRRDAAFLAALAFAFAPHRVMYVAHLQALMSGWLPVSLWGLHRYFDTGSRRALAVFAGAFALAGLSNGYFLYFFAVPVTAVAACHLGRSWTNGSRYLRGMARWREPIDLGWAALAVLAAIMPAALAYLRVRRAFGFHRAADEIAAFSARWTDYLRIPDGLWLWSGALPVGEGERMLFPGMAVVTLAAAAGLSLPRSWWPSASPQPARWAWHVGVYAVILGLAVWLAAGPEVPGPYGPLLRAVPGLDGLRVPARLVVVVALALSVLGSAGAAWAFSGLRPRAATVAAVAVGGVIALEGYGGPMRMVPFDHDQRPRARLNEWLRNGPPGGVLELPIAGPSLEPFTLVYQYNTLFHGHPIINGYSGYGYALQDFLGGPGSPVRQPELLPEVIDGLRSIGVRYVLVHQAVISDRPDLGWPAAARLVDAFDQAAGGQGSGRRFDGSVAWALAAPAARLPVDETSLQPVGLSAPAARASAMPEQVGRIFDGDLRTNWVPGPAQSGGEWLRFEFAGDLDIGRIIFLADRYGVRDYPRRVAVESETEDGSRMTLYSGSFLPMLMRGLAGGEAGWPAVLDLPSNRSRAIWIRQTGRSERRWAVHELQLYERRASR